MCTAVDVCACFAPVLVCRIVIQVIPLDDNLRDVSVFLISVSAT